MFNDMKFIGSYLMTAIISIFITHIIDKKNKLKLHHFKAHPLVSNINISTIDGIIQ